MNVARRGAYGAFGLVLGARWRPRQALVLSHMRAGSTLLTQIIANSDDVVGSGELHLPYRRHIDLRAMNGKIAWELRDRSPTAHVALDKVLHDYLLLPEDLPGVAMDADVVFLVRSGAKTLRSLVGSFGHTERQACDYYVARMRGLARSATLHEPERPSIALTYDDLVDRTADALAMIERHLDLPKPLSAEFTTNRRSGGGDPSANLREGRILREGEKVVHHDAPVAAQFVEQAEEAFAETWSVLASRCTTIDSD